jgi:hypothetical protein
MQLILSALVWCTILSVESVYRPVPMLDSFSDRAAQLARAEEQVKTLRSQGRLEEARRFEQFQELLWQEERRSNRGEVPQPTNPLKPWM